MLPSWWICSSSISILCWLFFCKTTDKPQFGCHVVKPSLSSRRQIIAHTSASLLAVLTFNCSLTPLPVWAESLDQKEEDQGVVGAIKSLFDPNETTKSGKVLPKAYLNSAREVVKTLRESLKEDPKDIVKFRRTADSAKESIRDYLINWKGQEKVAREVCILLSLTDLFQSTRISLVDFTDIFIILCITGIVRWAGKSNQIFGQFLLQGRSICSITRRD